ncbi:pyocin activator PrtN family protein [Burkholderia contaminans]|uniref:pyocin activator PrtN family protein n=1 Tax=Burkholderia contaminans TaxID=488447 RepID=UPI00158A0AFC|nr:pyocin activator PrtN family protein [Burkholderia contaminans]
MNTVFLLMAQYGATAVVPVELVCRDYFSHLTSAQLVRKVSLGEIALPLVRIEESKKSAKGVHIQDLASYIDEQRAAARKECEQLRA